MSKLACRTYLQCCRCRKDATAAVWLQQWRRLPTALRLAPVRAGECGSANACVGVGAGGHCVCYSDR